MLSFKFLREGPDDQSSECDVRIDDCNLPFPNSQIADFNPIGTLSIRRQTNRQIASINVGGWVDSTGPTGSPGVGNVESFITFDCWPDWLAFQINCRQLITLN